MTVHLNLESVRNPQKPRQLEKETQALKIKLSNHAGHKYDYLSRAAEASSNILKEKMVEIRNKRTRLKVFHDQGEAL